MPQVGSAYTLFFTSVAITVAGTVAGYQSLAWYAAVEISAPESATLADDCSSQCCARGMRVAAETGIASNISAMTDFTWTSAAFATRHHSGKQPLWRWRISPCARSLSFIINIFGAFHP